MIGDGLRADRRNRPKAAPLLGLNRNTLRKKIKALDIAVHRVVKYAMAPASPPGAP